MPLAAAQVPIALFTETPWGLKPTRLGYLSTRRRRLAAFVSA
jgi:hypothetical protein